MSKEIDKEETMTKTKSKKTTKKKKVSKKLFQESMENKGGSNPSPSTPKSEITPPPQVAVQKFKDLEGKFLLVKVGTNDRPASDEDILDIETKLVGLLEENSIDCVAFVTHHAVEFEIIEKLK